MDEEWVRDIRDECDGFGTAFFYKQAVVNGKVTPRPYLDGRQHLEIPDIKHWQEEQGTAA